MAAISAAIRALSAGGSLNSAASFGGRAVQMAGQVGGNVGETATETGLDLQQLTSRIGSLGTAAKMTVDPVGLLNTALTEVLGPVNKFVGSVQQLNRQFVGVFSPAEVKLFDMAVRDLYATIGEMLTPVTREATRIIKEISATFNGLTPLVKEFVRDGLATMRPVLQSTMELMKELLAIGVPLAQIALDGQLQVWKMIASSITLVTDGLRTFYATIREFLGLPAFEPRDATGKAAVSTSQQSVESFLTQMQLNALKMGRGEVDIPKEQLNVLNVIKDEIVNLANGLSDKIKAGVSELPTAIANQWKDFGDKLKELAAEKDAVVRAGAQILGVPGFIVP